MTIIALACLVIFLPITTFSQNLFCDSNIIWTLQSFSVDTEAAVLLNHTKCKLSTTQKILAAVTHRAMMNDMNYIFSNASLYPLIFSIRGIPFGISPGPQIGIIFYLNGGYYGYTKSVNISTTLTYEWPSIDTTLYNYYIDGVLFDTVSTGTHPASSITDIGITVVSSDSSASTGVIFDFASLSFVAKDTSLAPFTTINPTQFPLVSTTKVTQDTFIHTMPATDTTTTEQSTSASSTEHIIHTTKANQEAEVEAQSTQMPFNSTKMRNIPDAKANNLFWIIVVIVSCVLCVSILVVLIKVICHKYQQQKDTETSLVLIVQPAISEAPGNVPRGDSKADVIKITKKMTLVDSNTISTTISGSGGINDEIQKIRTWLEAKMKCGEYLRNFVENGYDTMEIICEINDVSHLEEIGIESVEHKLIIIREIQKLNEGKVSNMQETTKRGEIEVYYNDDVGSMTIR